MRTISSTDTTQVSGLAETVTIEATHILDALSESSGNTLQNRPIGLYESTLEISGSCQCSQGNILSGTADYSVAQILAQYLKKVRPSSRRRRTLYLVALFTESYLSRANAGL